MKINGNYEGGGKYYYSIENAKHTSELRQNITPEKFEAAFKVFLEQAEKNAVSGKSHGGRTPYGFDNNTYFDEADFVTHYGQGAASKTPYINWWVLSIYYVVDKGSIVMGIEERRYPHLERMKPIRFKQIGNKRENVAVFYETLRDRIDYATLHLKFITIAEEIMRLGLR